MKTEMKVEQWCTCALSATNCEMHNPKKTETKHTPTAKCIIDELPDKRVGMSKEDHASCPKCHPQPQHTPPPWELNNFEIVNEVRSGLVQAVPIYTGRIEGTLSPASDDWDKAQANAAFIVRAVNAHEELVTALKMARGQLLANDYDPAFSPLKDIEQAIAKAEAQS